MEQRERHDLRKIKVAAIQAEPIFLDLDKTTEKSIDLIELAGENNVDLLAFPETFIPSFPNWYENLSEGYKVRNLDKELFKNSVEMDGYHIQAIAEACERANVNAVVGINERIPGTTGTMFNTHVHITRNGIIAGKHQKYVATTGERQVHSPGKTGIYNSFVTDFGPVSGLICGENSNPLAMYAAALNYPVVHVCSWPAYFYPYFPMRHAVLTASAGLAYSLKTFVVNSVCRISEKYIDVVAESEEQRNFLTLEREKKPGGIILDCMGRIIAEGTGSDDELLIAEIDLEDIIIPKLVADVAGHYNRPELFAPIFKEYLK